MQKYRAWFLDQNTGKKFPYSFYDDAGLFAVDGRMTAFGQAHNWAYLYSDVL